MNKIISSLVMVFIATLSLPAFGTGFSTLTSAELKAMIEQNEPGLVIIDSRSQSQFDEAHINGALNIPLAAMEQNPALPEVPKDTTLVFYCSGNT
ncbi:MAG: rhodanese-like domain-containing protein [Deltaproteobacteria bacterium]|nr:rhodanese-like domain-containing protein [Deltaproteobacteria bacterium]